MSTIKTGTTLTTAYQVEGDTTGALVIQTGGTPTTAATFDSSQNTTVAGNLTLSGSAKRITGDFSNATVANRVMFQTSTANGNTVVGVIPNGTGLVAGSYWFNNSDPTNAGAAYLRASTTDITFQSTITGTGTYLPMTFYTGGSERMRIDSSGNVSIGTSSPSTKLHVSAPNSGITVSGGAGTATNLYLAANGNTAGVTSVDVIQGGDSNGYFYNRANAGLIFGTNNTERMRIDSSGNVGIGTSSPTLGNSKLTVSTGVTAQHGTTPALQLYNTGGGSNQKYLRIVSTTAGALNFEKVDDTYSSATALLGVTSAGLFQMNSGYGSVATAYGCRAWVNFNGTGTVAIRASGNVSSITDNGTGNYTVNFTTAMPDASYATAATSGGITDLETTYTTSAVQILTRNMATALEDSAFVCVSIFR